MRDSTYTIKALELSHIQHYSYKNDLGLLSQYIDVEFEKFDIVSTEVVVFIVEQFGEAGRKEIQKMLEKKQLFMKQAKRFLLDDL